MESEEIKNSEIWNEIKNGNFSRIEEMTEITQEIASILVEKLMGKNETIVLNVVSISDKVAQELSKHNGDLWLRGITAISDSTAEALAKHRGKLGLSGLKSISPATARIFVKYKTNVYLSGLASITNEVAEILSEYENTGWFGLGVNLNIREIIESHKKENIEILEKIKSYSLLEAGFFHGAEYLRIKEFLLKDVGLLKILTAEAAEILSNKAGEWLNLSGLISLSLECARALSKHNGVLILGPDALSEEAAKELTDHIGDICFQEWGVLSGVKKSTLSNFKSRICFGNWEWSGRYTDREGYLDYRNLEMISPEMAVALAAQEGWLDLSKLRSLSNFSFDIKRKLKSLFGYQSFNSIADILSTHKGALDLSGLIDIADEDAISLLKHRGPLYLDGLQKLSFEAADSLIDHKGYLSLGAFSGSGSSYKEDEIFAKIFAKRDNNLFIPRFRRKLIN